MRRREGGRGKGREGGREEWREGGLAFHLPRSATVCMARSSGELSGSKTSHSMVSL